MIRISDKLWLVLSSFFAAAMRIGVTLVMARWVSRDDYGLFVVIGALPGLLSFNDLAISASLIQMRDESDLVRDTAVTVGLTLYGIYSVMLIGGGAYMTWTHHDWRLWLVGLLIALTNMLNFLYGVRLAQLNQRLHFTAESRQNFIYALSQGAAGIAFAFGGLGIFALTLQGLFGQIVASVAIRRRTRLRWPRSFSPAVAKRLVSMGGKVGAAAYVSNLQNSTTALSINQMAGAGRTADWGRALGIVQLFAQNIMNGLERVAYPTLCRAVHDIPRLRDLIGKVTITLMLAAGFTGAWMYATREDLVRLGLGGQWPQVPPLLGLLCASVPGYALYISSYHACYAMGRAGVMLINSIITAVIFLPVLFFVHKQGVIAIAWVWIGGQFLIALLNFAWVAAAVRLPLGGLAARGAGLLAAGAAAGAVMRLIRGDLPGINALARFVTCSAAGAIIYLLLVTLTQRQVMIFAWKMARGDRRGGRS